MLRKNAIRARKTMEMLSLSSLVASLGDCRNLGAKAGPVTHFWPRSDDVSEKMESVQSQTIRETDEGDKRAGRTKVEQDELLSSAKTPSET